MKSLYTAKSSLSVLFYHFRIKYFDDNILGGVKEKTMAGRRAGATTFIFPRANQQEFEKLPAYLREGISAHFVDDYKEIIPIVFGPGFVNASERLLL